MNPGTHQDQRLPAALGAGFIRPDELGLAKRMRATLEFSAHLAFVDPQGRPAGTWGEALERDESFILADIAEYPVEREHRAFAELLAGNRTDGAAGRLRDLLVRMDRWLQLLGSAEGPQAQALSLALASAVDKRLGACLDLCADQFKDKAWMRGLSPLWLQAAQSHEAAPKDGAAPERLRRAMAGLLQAVGDLAPKALENLLPSLRSGRHDPAMGLLIAFLRLHERSLEPLNRFPERLTDFYYRDILGMRERPPALEKAHLVLDVDPAAPPVSVEKGLRFAGARDGKGAAVEFSADQGCTLSKTQLSALCTINLVKDPLISPEREFGFASRVKARSLPLPGPGLAGAPGEWWPLFGNKTGNASSPDGRLGFALSSPVFELSEGDRTLTVGLRLSGPSDRDARLKELLKSPPARADAAWLARVFELYHGLDEDGDEPFDAQAEAVQALARSSAEPGDPQLRYLVSRCLGKSGQDAFCGRLGMLFTVWLTEPSLELAPADRAALKAHALGTLGRVEASALAVDDPLTLVFGERPPERTMLFDRIFRGLFQAKVSCAAGWYAVDTVFCTLRSQDGGAAAGSTIALSMRLGPEEPAVTPCAPAMHGRAWPAQAAVQLELQTHTRVFGYTLLRRLEWKEIELSVSVHGLRNVLAYNQMGRLDPGKPFQPFGPLPELGSHLILGSREMAAKPLREVRVRLEWGNPPREEGGLAQHYEGYPGDWRAEGFQVQAAILRDGQWQAGLGAPLGLFHESPASGRLSPLCSLDLDPLELRRNFRWDSAETDGQAFEYGSRSRNGFFRFELAGPDQAFGHALYPRLVTETLTSNARLKRNAPLPLAPYTPVIQWLQVDYRASHSIRPAQDSADAGEPSQAGPVQHRIYHLGPFGTEELRLGRHRMRPFVLPPVEHEGNLYLGLKSENPQGLLNLLFHMRPESAGEALDGARPRIHWSVWRPEGWSELPAGRVVSDSTLGFLRSGIVCLDLPKGMSEDCGSLGEGAYWLRLSTDGNLDDFAGLRGVYVNAISATRVRPDPERPDPASLGGVAYSPLRGVAGLRKVLQVGPSFGQRGADARKDVLLRGGERLSHKGRASAPWDYERLLLDAFGAVAKAKAFPNLAVDTRRGLNAGLRRPGQVLVVVVPRPGKQGDLGEGPRFDAAALESMAVHLRRLAHPGASIAVRNASYERIQVRCSVRWSPGQHPGAGLRLLNEAVVRYLSPWTAPGLGMDFGWELRARDLEAYLRSQPGVDFVGRLSLLHIVQGVQDFYGLGDSARMAPQGGDWSPLVRPAQPWSLALPVREHLIESVDHLGRLDPVPTGINLLEVGNTFIISRPNHDQ